MQYTQNFSLRKPDLFEDADVRQLNSNADDIDNLLYRNRRISTGPEWDNTTQYNVGDLVVYEHVLYRCIESTIGAWDSTKWVTTHLTDEVITARGDFANQNIADEFDSTSTYEVGDYVIYEENLYKCTTAITVAGTWNSSDWTPCIITDEMGSGGSAVVTKTAEGNPIEISDAADAPLVKCVTEIQGSQDLHGYDKPWVGGAGKNKFGGEFGTSYKYPIPSGATQMTFSAKSNGSYKLSVRTYDSNGTKTGSDYVVVDAGNTTGYISVTLPNDAVTFILFISGGGSATDFSEVQAEVGSTATAYEPYSNICPITAYTEGKINECGKNRIDNSSSAWETGAINSDGVNSSSTTQKRTIGYYPLIGGQVYTISGITIPSTTSDIRFFQYDENDDFIGYKNFNAYQWTPDARTRSIRMRTPIDLDISNLMIEKGESASTYEPYTSTTHTTTYPSAIYRGSEDVVNGEVGADWLIHTMELSDLTAVYSLATVWRIGTQYFRDTIKSCLSSEVTTAIASKFNAVSENGRGPFYSFYQSNPSNILYFDIPKSDAATEDDAKAIIAGSQLAYELATHTTSSVTPTNLPIKSLLGYNHIESSTGELDIEYITEDFQPIVDLIEKESGGSRITKLWDAGFTPSPGVWLEYDFGENLEGYDAIVIEFVVSGWEGDYSDSVTIYPQIQHLNSKTCYHYVKGTDYGIQFWCVSGTTYGLGAISGSYPPQYKAIYGIKY